MGFGRLSIEVVTKERTDSVFVTDIVDTCDRSPNHPLSLNSTIGRNLPRCVPLDSSETKISHLGYAG